MRLRRIGRLVFIGPFVIAFSRDGSMGYTIRWRWLSPISTRFKILVHRCDWCLRRVSQCRCWDGLE